MKLGKWVRARMKGLLRRHGAAVLSRVGPASYHDHSNCLVMAWVQQPQTTKTRRSAHCYRYLLAASWISG